MCNVELSLSREKKNKKQKTKKQKKKKNNEILQNVFPFKKRTKYDKNVLVGRSESPH